jgi:pimeloyl-ACP methyl ester carboxylesterase
LSLLATEPLRALAEFARLQLAPPPGAPGDGHPVLIFPGLASDGRPIAPLRQYCSRLGYAAQDWGRGINIGPTGDINAWLQALVHEMRSRLAVQEEPVTLIGWSLGGLYAREIAKLPDLRVRQVITLGTPFNSSVGETHAAWLYRVLNGRRPELDPLLQQRLLEPPPVPTTSIYSRSDGVVAWQACCHAAPRPQLQDVEVQGSHLGMGWNPEVLHVVADRLAQPAHDWRPYGAVRPAPRNRGPAQGRSPEASAAGM